MILADTSIWVDHLRHGNRRMRELLEGDRVACHPFVLGELACGRLTPRGQILQLLSRLRSMPEATTDEALAFIEAHDLMGRGLGWIDVHLLLSAQLASTPVWTLDRALAAAARRIGCSADV